MTENTRPNVLLVISDQYRRDALGVNRPDFAHTPHLDEFARNAVNFTNAYSACPSCIAARATLLTGMKHENHGFTGYDSRPVWKYDTTLPGVMASAGYHTQCVGKMHVEPARNLMGFHNVVLHDGFLHDKRWHYRNPIQYDDYLPDVSRYLGPDVDICDTGLGCNGYATREWTWDERLHPTAWVTTKSIEFLRRRDTTKPFFLKTSYHRPHSPLDPPPSYLSMYEGRTLPPVHEGDWDDEFTCYTNPENPIPEDKFSQERARKASCALVSQIDYELNRIFIELANLGLWHNTLIIFMADHGDMLFDHGLVRKGLPFENSSGIPLVVKLPRSMSEGRIGTTDTRLAEIRDIFPTICDACGIDLPPGIDGRSLLSPDGGHEIIHGEHPAGEESNQWLTDGKEKYCWFSQTGRELLFDLINDPDETHDIAHDRKDRIAFWSDIMVKELSWRNEGYVKDGKLQTGQQVDPSQPWVGIGRTAFSKN